MCVCVCVSMFLEFPWNGTSFHCIENATCTDYFVHNHGYTIFFPKTYPTVTHQ